MLGAMYGGGGGVAGQHLPQANVDEMVPPVTPGWAIGVHARLECRIRVRPVSDEVGHRVYQTPGTSPEGPQLHGIGGDRKQHLAIRRLGELRMTRGSGMVRSGLSHGPDVVCMLHDTLRDTVAFLCPLSCSPPSPTVSVAFRVIPQVPAPRLPVPWWGCGGGGGGGFDAGSGPHPPVFPLGGADACTLSQGVTLLYGPSICTRSVQMDLRRSQVLRPFPTPGSGTLWVAGEPLQDRRVLCLPRWTLCPTRSPSLGTNRSTCRGEWSLSGPLVSPPGRGHLGPLTNGPGSI